MTFKMRCPKCGGRDYGIERDRAFARSSGTVEYVFSCRCGKQLFGPQLQAEHDRQKALWKDDGSEAAPAEVPAGEDPLEEERVLLDSQRRERQAFERRRRETTERRIETERLRIEEERRASEAQTAAAEVEREREIAAQRERLEGERKKAEAESRKRTDTDRKRVDAERARLDSERREADRKQADKAKREAAKLEGERRRAARKLEEAQRHADARQVSQAEAQQAVGEAQFTADGEDNGICGWPGCGKASREGSRYCSRDCSNKNARHRHKQRKDIVAA